MAISTYAADKLLDHLFGKTAFTQPTKIVVHLSKADPGDDGAGIDEPDTGSYAPVETAPANWDAADDRMITSAIVVAFPTPTATWGVIRYFYLTDESDAFLGSGPLAKAITVELGSLPPTFPVGTLRMAFSPGVS